MSEHKPCHGTPKLRRLLRFGEEVLLVVLLLADIMRCPILVLSPAPYSETLSVDPDRDCLCAIARKRRDVPRTEESTIAMG